MHKQIVTLVTFFSFISVFLVMLSVDDVPDLTKSNVIEANRNVYVCITGQLSRLELHNKINKLFIPLHNRGYHLFIGLALITDTALYVNSNSGDKMRLYDSIAQVQQTLLNVSGVVKVKHFSQIDNLGDLYFNNNYQKSLGYVNTSTRVELHARQYRVLQHCNNPEMFKTSSFFVRLREDAFIDRIQLDPIIRKAKRGAVITTACDAWWGMNDKMAFGPISRATDFFLLPYQYYVSLKKIIDNFNPEQLYRNSYEEKGLNLLTTSQYIVTKAVTVATEKGLNHATNWKNCTITGNSFHRFSKKCPKGTHVSSDTSYTAECQNIFL